MTLGRHSFALALGTALGLGGSTPLCGALNLRAKTRCGCALDFRAPATPLVHQMNAACFHAYLASNLRARHRRARVGTRQHSLHALAQAHVARRPAYCAGTTPSPQTAHS